MKKIVITTFIMPNEIDDLERILMDLNKASKYVKGENYELYLALTVSDFLVDWDNSKLDKQYFIDTIKDNLDEETSLFLSQLSSLLFSALVLKKSPSIMLLKETDKSDYYFATIKNNPTSSKLPTI